MIVFTAALAHAVPPDFVSTAHDAVVELAADATRRGPAVQIEVARLPRGRGEHVAQLTVLGIPPYAEDVEVQIRWNELRVVAWRSVGRGLFRLVIDGDGIGDLAIVSVAYRMPPIARSEATSSSSDTRVTSRVLTETKATFRLDPPIARSLRRAPVGLQRAVVVNALLDRE